MDPQMKEMDRQIKIAWKNGHDYGCIKTAGISVVSVLFIALIIGLIS